MQHSATVQALILGFALLAVVAMPPLGGFEAVPTAAAQVFKPHAPIKITHNNDFRATENGVSGHGTSSSPYIIEGWEFTANTSGGDATEPAIWITGTSAFFVIKNCRFAAGPDRVAIKFEDMSNGVITENQFVGNQIAMQLTRAGKVDVLRNRVEGSTLAGMVLTETGQVKTRENTFTANANDIQLNVTDRGEITQNTFTTKGIGVDFSEGAGFKMIGNTFTGAGGSIGARVNGMDAGEVRDNKFSGFTQWGLLVQRSNNGKILNNEANNNGGLVHPSGGIAVEESSSLRLETNKANNNRGQGVYLYQTSQSWILSGEANMNAVDGIELRLSSQDGIKNMQANENGRAGINLNESSSNLIEENKVLRNKVRDNGSIIVGGNDNKVVRNEVGFGQGFGILITQWMSGNQILANNLHDNRLEPFYTDSDPNANIFSSEEDVGDDKDDGDDGGGARGLGAPSAPFAFVALALLGLAVAIRRRR